MPTVRGLIQDIQHHGLLRQNNLSLLSGCTIGVDATLYFDPLYTPPSASDILGAIDYTGLDIIVKKHLAQFQTSKITPIFVFPGVSSNDRVYTTQQQDELHQTQLKQQLELQQSQQPQQQPSEQQNNDDAGFGFYRPLAKNKRHKKNQFDSIQPANGMITQQQQQQQQTGGNTSSSAASTTTTSATSTISSPMDEVQWSFDERSLLNRQRGWDQINNKNYDQAQQLFYDMSTSFTFQYRKALLQLLQKHQKTGEFGHFSVLIAPYSVSAQLAWLQRAPHHYVHAVVGQSDVLLFGVERYLQTINFDTQTFNFIILQEVLTKYSISINQLISASILTGYSYALTHPLALADFKTPSTYSFSNALNHLRSYGQGSLQTLFEWWIQQPPGPTTSTATVVVNDKSNVKDDLLHLPGIVSLEEQLATVISINKVLQQFQGSLVFGHGAELVLLRQDTCEAVDIPKLTAYGKCSQRQFKEQVKQYQQRALQNNLALLKGKQLVSILQSVAITPQQLIQQYTADKINIPQELITFSQNFKPTTTTVETSSVPTTNLTPTPIIPIIPIILPNNDNEIITTRPNIPLPQPILHLVSSATIQPASLSSILTGHILDVTVQNPSNQLDQILDWTNLTLRGPAIWSVLHSFTQNSSKTLPNSTTPLVDPAYKTLYSTISQQQPQTQQQQHEQLPFILNSRFNDKRKSLYPRDVIAYCRRGGNDGDISYGVDKINQFENIDKIFSEEQLLHFQNLVKNMSKTDTTTPISHYITLLPALYNVQPHPDPSTSTQGGKKKKAAQNNQPIVIIPVSDSAIKLTEDEQFIGLGMLFILYFVGLITAQGILTRLGFSIMNLVKKLQEKQVETSIYDTLFLIYILTAGSDVMTTKYCTIESSELHNPNSIMNAKNEISNAQRFSRIVFRLLATLPSDLQDTILQKTPVAPEISPMSEETTTISKTLSQVLLTTQPTTPEEIALVKKLSTTVSTLSANLNGGKNNNKNQNNNRAQNQKQQSLQERFVPTELLSIINREIACYSSIVTSLLHSLNYSFDLILTALSLYQLYPKLNFSIVSTLLPLQHYQPAPILSSLLRQRYIVNPPTKGGKNSTTPSAPSGYSLLAPNTPTISTPEQQALVGMWDAIVQGTGGVGVTTDEIESTLKNIL